MGFWNPGKGAWGKVAKGTYGLEDDWSEGYSGYNSGYEDTALFSLAREAADEWQFPKNRGKLAGRRSYPFIDRALLPIRMSAISTV